MIGNLLRTALFSLLVGSAATVSVAANAQTLALVGRQAVSHRLTPRRFRRPWFWRPAASSPRSAAAAKSKSPRMRGSSIAPERRVVAGFWNSHVHFTEGPCAKTRPVHRQRRWTEHMQAMLTRWGFTTVWDLGSDPNDSLPLRRRVNSGEVAGPDILFARQHLPQGRSSRLSAAPRCTLPEAATPEEAAQLARDYSRNGRRRHQALHRCVHGRTSLS